MMCAKPIIVVFMVIVALGSSDIVPTRSNGYFVLTETEALIEYNVTVENGYTVHWYVWAYEDTFDWDNNVIYQLNPGWEFNMFPTIDSTIADTCNWYKPAKFSYADRPTSTNAWGNLQGADITNNNCLYKDYNFKIAGINSCSDVPANKYMVAKCGSHYFVYTFTSGVLGYELYVEKNHDFFQAYPNRHLYTVDSTGFDINNVAQIPAAIAFNTSEIGYDLKTGLDDGCSGLSKYTWHIGHGFDRNQTLALTPDQIAQLEQLKYYGTKFTWENSFNEEEVMIQGFGTRAIIHYDRGLFYTYTPNSWIIANCRSDPSISYYYQIVPYTPSMVVESCVDSSLQLSNVPRFGSISVLNTNLNPECTKTYADAVDGIVSIDKTDCGLTYNEPFYMIFHYGPDNIVSYYNTFVQQINCSRDTSAYNVGQESPITVIIPVDGQQDIIDWVSTINLDVLNATSGEELSAVAVGDVTELHVSLPTKYVNDFDLEVEQCFIDNLLAYDECDTSNNIYITQFQTVTKGHKKSNFTIVRSKTAYRTSVLQVSCVVRVCLDDCQSACANRKRRTLIEHKIQSLLSSRSFVHPSTILLVK